MAVSNSPLAVPLDHLLRELTPQVIGTVVRRFHDFAAAEDAVSFAGFAAAGAAKMSMTRKKHTFVAML